MAEYNNMYVCHEARDGQYGLKSYWTSSQTVEFDDGQNLEEYKTEISQNIDTKGDTIGYSLDDGEVFLYSDDNKIATETMQLKTSPNVTLDDISNLSIRLSKGKIRFTWRDPSDVVFSELPLITWAGTKVIRKIGSAPNDVTDGTLVIDSKDRDTYSSTPYFDEPSTNNVYYYYRFFPYDTNGNYYGKTCGVIYKPIRLIPVDPPQFTETYTYTGQNITPNFTNYDTNFMTRGGTVYAKNAGDYSTTFTLKEGYKWSDDTVEPKTVNWSIGKANGYVTLSSDNVNITGKIGATQTVNITSSSGGNISVVSVDENIVTASLNTNVITLVGMSAGNATVRVNVSETNNYTSSVSIIGVNSQVIHDNNTWTTKTWSGLPAAVLKVMNGSNIWTDGDDIYYSYNIYQYKLDRTTSTWNAVTWNVNIVYGRDVWTDGENIYYSGGSNQYVLDKSTSTWNPKTWNELSSFHGSNIWTDGTDIYYSTSGTDGQRVLDKSTSTWNVMSWNGRSSIIKSKIWKDGSNIYYSDGSSSAQYVLDKSTHTWEHKDWSGLYNIYGDYIWHDGDNIYYSIYDRKYVHYVLNKDTSTWSSKIWNGTPSFRGDYVWYDDDIVYSSYGDGSVSTQLELVYVEE